jgi:putative FmdB family regulatory protein
MPLYEYRCLACLQRFEVLRRMGQGCEDVACPACGHGRVEKEHSTFAASGTSTAGGCAPGGARFT